MKTLSEVLESQGFTLDPEKIERIEDKILESPELVKEASDLWQEKEGLIRMIIQARINAMAKKALDGNAELLPTYQKAMAEVGAIAMDFEGYKGEAGRLASAEKKDNSVEAENSDTPSEGESEGSL